MKNLLLIIILAMLPLISFSQKSSWHFSVESGMNVSFNRMTAINGNDDLLENKKVIGGYWGLQVAYEITARTAFTFGLDHVAYKKKFSYGSFRGPSVESQAKTYILGIPIGIENYWLVDRKFEIVTGYGIKYRINNTPTPISASSNSTVSNNGVVVEQFSTRDFAYSQNKHLFSLYGYAELRYKIKPFLHIGLKVGYNQGMTSHESFQFEAVHDYPVENRTATNEFLYESKASYFSTGLSLSYIFINNK